MVSLTVYSTINHATSLLVAVAIMRPARWRWQISAPIIRPASVFKIAQQYRDVPTVVGSGRPQPPLK